MRDGGLLVGIGPVAEEILENLGHDLDNFKWMFEETKVISSRYDLGKLHAEEEPHISLTKVGVTLQFHWINEFTKSKPIFKFGPFYLITSCFSM